MTNGMLSQDTRPRLDGAMQPVDHVNSRSIDENAGGKPGAVGRIGGRLAFAAALFAFCTHATPQWGLPTQTEYLPIDESSYIINPERGLYWALDLRSHDLLSECLGARKRGYSVVYTKAILPMTLDSSLDTALSEIDAGFRQLNTCGVKVVVRFYYLPDNSPCDEPGEPIYCTDPDLDLIRNHIAKLKPYLATHQAVIMAVQTGFLGPWGEWHGSNLSNDPAARAAVLTDLLKAVPVNRMVQVRTPAKRHAVFNGSSTVNLQNAIGNSGGPQPFDGSNPARAGHHNDCFLGSATDYATYTGSPDSITFKAEQAYVAQNTRYTPMGGQTCKFHQDYAWTEAMIQQRGLTEMRSMHWTYLDNDWNQTVREVLGARYPSYWDPSYHVHAGAHVGAWPEILRKLGYRFSIPKISYGPTIDPSTGKRLRVSVRIQNTGYAAMFNRRPVYLVLHNGSYTYTFQVPDVDPRKWESGQVYDFIYDQPIPMGVTPGTYTLSLWMPDADPALQNRPEYAVRIASSIQRWDPKRGYNILKNNAITVR